MQKPRILTIIGPTASGKTDISYTIAKSIQEKTGKTVEIISADSRQIYRHIPIATAQPPKQILKELKHHFINSLELDEDFNAGAFGRRAREIISKLLRENKVPIVVGGSGLYLSSLIYGLFDTDDIIEEESGKEKQKKIRANLTSRLAEEGAEALLAELKKVDDETVNSMSHVTGRRILRALEVYYLTGIPLSVLKNRKVEIEYEFVQYCVEREREELYRRINERADIMLEQGLINEIRALKVKDYHYTTHNSLNTVGVKEVMDYLDGKIDYERMAELIKQNTRRYAKRQITWFRRDKNIKILNPDLPDKWINMIIESLIK
jgi:tRNA dimethylallyltransferase